MCVYAQSETCIVLGDTLSFTLLRAVGCLWDRDVPPLGHSGLLQPGLV